MEWKEKGMELRRNETGMEKIGKQERKKQRKKEEGRKEGKKEGMKEEMKEGMKEGMKEMKSVKGILVG